MTTSSTATPPAPRLSLPFLFRLPVLSTTAFLVGSSLGASLGGHQAGLIFRAENAHRAPTSQKGWYFYHKSKNYRVMWGGIKGGVKMGAKTAGWVVAFTVCEDAVDRLRARVDAVSSVVAGLAGAGAFSLWNGLSWGLAVRTAKKGLLIGAAFGVAQDLVRLAKGQGGGVFEYVGVGRGGEVVGVVGVDTVEAS